MASIGTVYVDVKVRPVLSHTLPYEYEWPFWWVNHDAVVYWSSYDEAFIRSGHGMREVIR
jgi:hypothetical protein